MIIAFIYTPRSGYNSRTATKFSLKINYLENQDKYQNSISEKQMSSMKREELVEALIDMGRQYSTTTVLFHTVLAEVLGLNPSDHKIVDVLTQRGLLTAGQLAEITGLTTGSMTAALDRLEKAQFIKRVNDPNDRRKVLLQVLPNRFPELGELFTPMLKAQDELFARYSDSDLALILEYIGESKRLMDEAAIDMRQKMKGVK
jgi:DNA-binding MarR family transcriptional regulator